MPQTLQSGEGKDHLLKLAKKIGRASLDARLLKDLVQMKVGTRKIEEKAMKLCIEFLKYQEKEVEGTQRKKLKGKERPIFIKENRSSEEVCDLFQLKVKYATEEMKRLRREYRREKKETEERLLG